jgi:hypothetical protein
MIMEDQAAATAGAVAGGIMFVYFAVLILCIVSMWKLFSKAGQPGWAAIIPIYNVLVLLKVAGKPGWWLILFLIPVVSLVIAIITLHGVSTSFGKGAGFTVGLVLLPIVFFPMLAFGSATYSPRLRSRPDRDGRW